MAIESSRSLRERKSEYIMPMILLVDFFFLSSNQVNWVKAYSGSITELHAYVKTYHTTGLVWNKQVSCCLLS